MKRQPILLPAFILLATFLCSTNSFSQSSKDIATGTSLYVPMNMEYNYDLQKAMYSPDFRFHTSIQAWNIGEISDKVNYDSIVTLNDIPIRKANKTWKRKFHNKLLNNNVVELKRDNYWFAINPVVDFEVGREFNEEKTTYTNTRGLEIKGQLGKDVAFYTYVRENQADFPNYLTSWIKTWRVIPGQGKLHSTVNTGFDYNNAGAYLSYTPGKYFSFVLGQGKNFFGDGYRSMILSDNAFSYPFLKINVDFWNIKYTVLYNQMMDVRTNDPILGYPKKYTVMHYLSWAATNRLTINLFDAVVWAAQDSAGYRGFDWSYASPIIFLRPQEFSIGSAGNAILGMGASYIVGKHTVLYGQFMLDEFKIDEIRAGDGWWANKWSYQLGVKSYDVLGVPGLYLQTEYNRSRPYMYSHGYVISNYGHYNQPLASPLGANFWESVSFIKYNRGRWFAAYEFQYALYGLDEDGLNYGHNIYESYNTHADDYGNYVGQGLKTTVQYHDITVSYLVNPAYNLNFALGYTYRKATNDDGKVVTSWVHFGLRTSLFRRYYDL